MLGTLEAEVLPALAAILRFVYAISISHAALAVAFARANPNCVCVLRVHNDRADGIGAFMLEDRRPGRACVLGLPNSAAGCADEIAVAFVRRDGECDHTT